MGVHLRVRFLSPACLLQDASSGGVQRNCTMGHCGSTLHLPSQVAIWMALGLQLSAAERAPAVGQQRIGGWISARNRSSQELTSRTAPALHTRARSSSSRVPRCDASCMAGARCYDELSHSAPLKWYPPAAELRALCENDSDCRFKVVLKHFHQLGLKENRTYHCFKLRPVPPRCKPKPTEIEEQTTKAKVDNVSDSSLSPASTCILLTMCDRVQNYSYLDPAMSKNLSRRALERRTSRSDVYRDRVPRWAMSGLSTFAVDSCNGSLAVPGVTMIHHLQTKRIRYAYPSTRERDALLYALPRLPAACTFVFKVTAKYYPPDFVTRVLPRIPSDAAVVLQQSRYFGQGCEIFGAPREALLTQLGEEEWQASSSP